MQKNSLFIMTHLGSGWESLVEKLKEDQRFDFFKTDFYYHHPEDLEILTNNDHKRENSASIWCDVILHNKDFTCRALRKSCKFVYWTSPFNANIALPKPEDYYLNRLSGMKWYHKKTGGLWNPSLESDSLLSSILR